MFLLGDNGRGYLTKVQSRGMDQSEWIMSFYSSISLSRTSPEFEPSVALEHIKDKKIFRFFNWEKVKVDFDDLKHPPRV